MLKKAGLTILLIVTSPLWFLYFLVYGIAVGLIGGTVDNIEKSIDIAVGETKDKKGPAKFGTILFAILFAIIVYPIYLIKGLFLGVFRSFGRFRKWCESVWIKSS